MPSKTKLNLLAAFSAIFVAVLLLLGIFRFNLPFVFVLMVFILAALSGFLYLSLYGVFTKTNKIFSVACPANIKKVPFDSLLIFIFYLLGLLSLLLIPSLNSSLFVAWSDMTLFSWLRLFLVSPWLFLIPGYVFFSFFKKREQFSNLETVSSSILITIFFWSIISFLSILLGSTIENISVTLFVFASSFVTLLHFCGLKNRLDNGIFKKRFDSRTLCVYLSLLLIIVIVILLMYLGVAINGIYWGDEPFHFGRSLLFEHAFPVLRFEQFAGYPWLSHLYFAFCYVTSGFPAENMYLFLSFFGALPVIPFFLFASTFSSKKSIALVSTLFYSLFAGFGWIYAFTLTFLNPEIGTNKIIDIAGLKTYDIWLPASGSHFSLIMPFFISISCFLMLLYILRKPWKSTIIPCVYALLFTLLSVLSHKTEITIFVLIFSLFLLASSNRLPFKRKFGFSVLIGLLLVGLIDFIAPGKTYTIDPFGHLFSDSLYLAAIVLIMASISLSYLDFRAKIVATAQRCISLIAFKQRILISILLLAAYIGGFVTYFSLLPQINLTRDYVFQIGNVHWYFYPVRLGLVGFLVVVGVIAYVWGKKSTYTFNYAFLFSLTLFGLILSKIGPLFQFLLPSISEGLIPNFILENRITPFLWIPLCILAADITVRFIDKKIYLVFPRKVGKPARRFHANSKALFLLILLIGGLGGTFYQAQYVSLSGSGDRVFYTNDTSKIANELAALEVLRDVYTPNVSVATVSDISKSILSTYVGILPERIFSNGPDPSMPWNDVLYDTDKAEVVLNMIAQYNIRYLYVANRDLSGVSEFNQSYFFGQLFKYFPILFENTEATIYSIPYYSSLGDSPTWAFVTPSWTGSTILPETLTQQYQLAWQDDFSNSSSNWRIAGSSKTIEDFQINVTDNVLHLEGTFTEKSDYVWIETDVSVNTTEYPCIILQLKCAAPIANVRFFSSDAELLTGYGWFAAEGLYGQSLGTDGNWQTVVLRADSRAGQITKLQIMFDDLGSQEVSGLQSLSIDTIAMGKPLNFVNTRFLPMEMLSLANLEYTTCLEIDENKFNYPYMFLTEDIETSIDDYLNWVSNGGSLVVLNSNRRGAFAELLSIEETSTVFVNGINGNNVSVSFPENLLIESVATTDPTVELLSSYVNGTDSVSGFAYLKQYGQGQIVYINVKPYFFALESIQDPAVAAYLYSYLGTLLDVLPFNTTPVNSDLNGYFPQLLIMAVNGVTFNGSVNFQSTYLHLTQELSNSSIAINGETINGVITGFDIVGDYNLTLTTSEAKLLEGLGDYELLSFSNSSDWTLKFSPQSTGVFSIRFGSSVLKITISGGDTVELNLNDPIVDLLIGSPTTVNCAGEVYFDKCFSVYPFNPSSITENGASLLCTGQTMLKIRYSSENYVFIENIMTNNLQ